MLLPNKVWIVLLSALAASSIFLQPTAAAAQESSGRLQTAVSVAQKVTAFRPSEWRTEPTISDSNNLLRTLANNHHALSASPLGIVSMLANAKLPVAPPKQLGLPDLSKTKFLVPAVIQQEKWQVLNKS